MYEGTTLIEASLQKEFQQASKVLEDVPEAEKDWHPNTDGQVLNLVHPSMYPLCYGRTLVARSDGSVQVAKVPERLRVSVEEFDRWQNRERGYDVRSRKYCWLPTDFLIAQVRFSWSTSLF